MGGGVAGAAVKRERLLGNKLSNKTESGGKSDASVRLGMLFDVGVALV